MKSSRREYLCLIVTTFYNFGDNRVKRGRKKDYRKSLQKENLLKWEKNVRKTEII